MAGMEFTVTIDQALGNFAKNMTMLSYADRNGILARALNRGGDMARTKVRRSLVAQTGIAYGKIDKAMRTHKASAGNLVYTIVAKDNWSNLAAFKPRKTKGGISAAPWNKRQIFRGSFMVRSYGKVYARAGAERGPLVPLFGPNLAREVMRDDALAAWQSAPRFVQMRVEHELLRMFS